MSIIIISKGSYSHGGEVAEKVAQKLDYDCVSRDLLIEVSKKFNISELRLIRAVSDAPSFLEKYTFGRERYIAYIKAAVLEKLVKDNIIYHGFAGHFFVKDVSHVLKVRITADTEPRLTALMNRESVSKEEALQVLKQIDKERSKWSMKLYGIDLWDCRLYDMVINIGKISLDETVDLIYQTVQLEAFQPTAESKKRIKNLAGEAMATLKKTNNISPFFEPMRDSPFGKKREIKKDSSLF